MVSLVLYQPDIPQNAGTIMRLAACLSVKAHIIEPAGFVWSQKSFRRSGMDYLTQVDVERHATFEAFLGELGESRLIALTTKAATNYTDFKFEPGDCLLLGRESAGLPDDVHERCHHRVKVPMSPPARSLNVAVCAAMVLGDALRQTEGFPKV
ncbi:MAG: tRNA (cytidine(34)-2'-O)-methyltransferase [Hyphomicrobiales bacterium]